MWRNLFEHLQDHYGKIITVDLETRNQQIKESIGSSLPIDKYSEHIDGCIQYADDRKTPYMAAYMVITCSTLPQNNGNLYLPFFVVITQFFA